MARIKQKTGEGPGGAEKKHTDILLVTRDDTLRESLLNALSEHQRLRAVVTSCKDALEFLIEDDIELVIFDPDLAEMTGTDAIEVIKKLRPGIPMVVVSDDESYETGVRLAETGVYFNLSKPIDEDFTKELMSSVDRRLRKK